MFVEMPKKKEDAVDDELFVGKTIEFRPNGQISHLCSSNSELLLAVGSQQLLHIPLRSFSRNNEINVPLSSHERIAHIHLSISGRHAIVTTTCAENFYINVISNQLKPLKRFKGLTISAVGWNSDAQDESDTSFFLVGTVTGVVIESMIQSSGNQLYVKELTNSLTGEKDLPVTNIVLVRCDSDGSKHRWAVFICVPGRLYCFSDELRTEVELQSSTQPVIGTLWSSTFVDHSISVLQPLFSSSGSARYHTMDDSQRILPSAFVIHLHSSFDAQASFCWVASCGYVLGSVNFTQTNAYDMIIEKTYIKHKLVDGRYDPPFDVVLTDFHVLFLYSDRLEAISLLDHKSAYENYIGKNSGQLKGMCRQPTVDIIWIFTDSTIWKFKPNEETRNIWQIYLERGEYDKARAITSKRKDRQPFQYVIKREAEKLMNDKNFIAAAEVLAESYEPFESIVLKFLTTNEDRRDGLKRYLDLKLNFTSATEGSIQRDASVLWLVEVQLSELAEFSRMEKSSPRNRDVLFADICNPTTIELQARNVRQQLEVFLARPVVLKAIEANLKAVYRLMISHADFDSQLFLARKLNDYDTMVNVYLLQNEYQNALNVLTDRHSPAFYYKYSPSLVEHVPFELIVAWINERENLNPDLLLPALYRCQSDPKMVAAAFKYINFALDSNIASTSLHNFLISLYARHKSSALPNYFERFGLSKRDVPYNVEFALRVCLERPELRSCCVHLYCVDELYYEAVSLALSLDLDLAKKCGKRMIDSSSVACGDAELFTFNLQQAQSSLDLKRQIWLQIAKHIVEKQHDIVACIKLLKESDGVIKIQDVLPFFPEFATIELFKEPLCDCLKEHSGKIKELQKEMKDANDVARMIAGDMKKMKSRFAIIRANDHCDLCGEKALSKQLLAFTCRHFFHRDCLENAMRSSWTDIENSKFTQLLEREKLLTRLVEISEKDGTPITKKLKDMMNELSSLRLKISDAIAGQCMLCGPMMIQSIDQPFFTKEEYEIELSSW